MGTPPVSIFWLNYNSNRIIDIAKQSLSSVKDLDYPNYELILVDNGSKDDSLKHLVKHLHNIDLKAKILRSSCNLGYAGGNNLAYKHRDESSKYIVLFNSDFVSRPQSLAELIEVMESETHLGAIQGIILKYGTREICSSAPYIDQLLQPHDITEKSEIKERYVTYPSGCFSIIRVNAVKQLQGEYLFDEELFLYYEDTFLGVKLWNYGYEVKSIPIITGEHRIGASSDLKIKLFYNVRNRTALHQAIDTGLGTSFYRNLFFEKSPMLDTPSFFKALIEGFMAGRKIRRKYTKLKLSASPYIRLKDMQTILPER